RLSQPCASLTARKQVLFSQLGECKRDLAAVIAAEARHQLGEMHRTRAQRLLDGLEPWHSLDPRGAHDLRLDAGARQRTGEIEPGLGGLPVCADGYVHGKR